MRFSWITLFFCFIGCSALCAQQPNKVSPERRVIDGRAQGTTYHIVYYSDKQMEKSAIDSILNDIDLSMSIYNNQSLISRFNQSDVQEVDMDVHMKNVIAASFKYHKLSKGQFDITVAPLVQLWGFGPKRISSLPDSMQIQNALKDVGMHQLKVKGRRLIKTNPRVTIDLNGIAQGYSVDVLAAYLMDRGIKSFVVELGGELRIQGVKPDGDSMKVGIERPVMNDGKMSLKQDVVALSSGAITTAGNFEKFLMDKGRKITHHIDPRTGYSYLSNMVSVTVYAPSAMEGDALDNIFMAMSPKEALAFADKRKNVDIYVIYNNQNGEIEEAHTKGFDKLFRVNQNLN